MHVNIYIENERVINWEINYDDLQQTRLCAFALFIYFTLCFFVLFLFCSVCLNLSFFFQFDFMKNLVLCLFFSSSFFFPTELFNLCIHSTSHLFFIAAAAVFFAFVSFFLRFHKLYNFCLCVYPYKHISIIFYCWVFFFCIVNFIYTYVFIYLFYYYSYFILSSFEYLEEKKKEESDKKNI